MQENIFQYSVRERIGKFTICEHRRIAYLVFHKVLDYVLRTFLLGCPFLIDIALTNQNIKYCHVRIKIVIQTLFIAKNSFSRISEYGRGPSHLELQLSTPSPL